MIEGKNFFKLSASFLAQIITETGILSEVPFLCFEKANFLKKNKLKKT